MYIDENLSLVECNLLRDISLVNINKKEKVTKINLAKMINVKYTNPLFYKMIKMLAFKNIISHHATIGNAKLLEINFKKLKNLIDEQKECNKWYEYFEKYHICSW